jgi:hypothetical protein
MAKFYNARGEVVDAADGICPDGCHVRTSVMLLDATQRDVQAHYARPRFVSALGGPAGHAPGYCFDAAGTPDDDARATAYETMRQRLSDAWRGPSAANHAAAPTDAQPTAADAAYAAHDAWLRDAWRTPR